MKTFLYKIKIFFKEIFCYPQDSITVLRAVDYDVYWKEKRGSKIGELSSWQKIRAEYILATLQQESSITVADVGCGDGSILRYLKKNMHNTLKCVGYDNSDYALAKAQEFGVETHRLDISQPDSFELLINADYYLLLEVLEHIPHSEALLVEVLKKVSKGIFVSFPNTGFINHRLRMFLGRFPIQWRISPNEHVRFWTYKDLIWWLKALGIRQYEIHCYKGLPILNTLWPSLFAAAFIVFIKK